MIKKLLLTILLILLLPVWAGAADYYVTQDGAGAPMSMAEFNALTGTGYAGDTFYFSGTFTTALIPGISGTAGGGYVTLDGYEADDYDPINTPAGTHAKITSSGSGEYFNLIRAQNYINVQDFQIILRQIFLFFL